MKRLIVRILGALILALTPAVVDAAGSDLLIRNVAVVDAASNQVTTQQDIRITDGRIAEVKPTGEIVAGAESKVRDGSGLYALPGLINIHAHIGNGGLKQNTPLERAQALERFLRYGVTTIFVPGGGGGNEDQLESWRARCTAGELRCPDVFGSGAIITAPGSHPIGTIWNMPADVDPALAYGRGAVAVAEDDDVGPLIRRMAARGIDAVKIAIEDWDPDDPHPRLSAQKVAELASAAHAEGLSTFAHVSRAEHVADALAGGVDGTMHSAEDRIPDELLEAMAEAQFFYVATLSLYDGFIDACAGAIGADHEPYAIAGSSPDAISEVREFRCDPVEPFGTSQLRDSLADNVRRAAAAGVPLAVGSDVNNPTVFPGYSTHEELELLVAAGLTPAQALTAATRGSAAFLGRGDQLGRIAPGYEADLLLLAENPLENILATRTLRAVIHDGHVLEDVVSTAPVRGATGGGGPIIDMHLHAFAWDEYGDPPPPNDLDGRRPAARSDDEAMHAALAAMDEHGIVLAVASGRPERVDRWRQAAPDRILGGFAVGGRTPLPPAEMLRDDFASGRFAVHGELGLQYMGIGFDDPRLEEHFALAAELDIPVGLHSGLGPPGSPYACCPAFRTHLGNPAKLEEILVRHPRLRLYLMHAGYPWLQETLALLYMYPQLHVDIAVLNWTLPRAEFHRYLKALVTAGFSERILFGSDQMIWPELIGPAIEAVASATFLTDAEKRDIFYWNAVRFLRLSEEEIGRHHARLGIPRPEPRALPSSRRVE